MPGKPTARAFEAFLRAYQKSVLIRTTGDTIAMSPAVHHREEADRSAVRDGARDSEDAALKIAKPRRSLSESHRRRETESTEKRSRNRPAHALSIDSLALSCSRRPDTHRGVLSSVFSVISVFQWCSANKTMKFVIAQMQHETNTFSPVPTPWEAFGKDGPYLGKAAYARCKGTRVPMAAYLDLAEAAKARGRDAGRGLGQSRAGRWTAKPTTASANLICDAVAKGCDAVFLDLHGAMVVADRTDDGEGTLLREDSRRSRRTTPIAVSLDLHAQRHRQHGAQLRRASPATRPIHTSTVRVG